eukprot:1158712-Pelagomonas_calceolata.AAC.5
MDVVPVKSLCKQLAVATLQQHELIVEQLELTTLTRRLVECICTFCKQTGKESKLLLALFSEVARTRRGRKALVANGCCQALLSALQAQATECSQVSMQAFGLHCNRMEEHSTSSSESEDDSSSGSGGDGGSAGDSSSSSSSMSPDDEHALSDDGMQPAAKRLRQQAPDVQGNDCLTAAMPRQPLKKAGPRPKEGGNAMESAAAAVPAGVTASANSGKPEPTPPSTPCSFAKYVAECMQLTARLILDPECAPILGSLIRIERASLRDQSNVPAKAPNDDSPTPAFTGKSTSEQKPFSCKLVATQAPTRTEPPSTLPTPLTHEPQPATAAEGSHREGSGSAIHFPAACHVQEQQTTTEKIDSVTCSVALSFCLEVNEASWVLLRFVCLKVGFGV